jgi:hypothetical protein
MATEAKFPFMIGRKIDTLNGGKCAVGLRRWLFRFNTGWYVLREKGGLI